MPTKDLWSLAIERGASDIHVLTGHVPMLRVDGKLEAAGPKPLAVAEVKQLMLEFVTEADYKKLLEMGDIDCSHEVSTGERLRINCHLVRGQPAFAARLIPSEAPTVEEIKLPAVVMDICRQDEGLVLVTGPTGSGKTTTLAAIINQINKENAVRIITLEDPIEFLYESDKALISQRELGTDFPSFPEGLKHVLRQDPDIVMVGEMRDLESIALALTLAETGHLVLATLHTPNSFQTIDRIVDVFPSHQQSQIRLQLSLSLKAVIAQQLVPAKGGSRIANREILVNNAAVANIIREQRLAELPSVIQTNADQGMVTFEKDYKRLQKEGLVD